MTDEERGPLGGRRPRQVAAIEQDSPEAQRLVPGEDTEQGRLASTRRAHHREHLASASDKINARQRIGRPEAAAEVGGAEAGHATSNDPTRAEGKPGSVNARGAGQWRRS